MTHNEAATHGMITFEEYARLPDDGYRTQLVRGVVVREPQPAYGHGRVQARLLYRIEAFLEQSGLPFVCVGPIGSILARNPDTVRGPDVAVIRSERLPPRNSVGYTSRVRRTSRSRSYRHRTTPGGFGKRSRTTWLRVRPVFG